MVFPVDGKPVMLDDTSYYLSFDSAPEALCIVAALNSPPARAFLEAISFRDGKRVFSKEVLSRINFIPLLNHQGFESWATSTLKVITALDRATLQYEEIEKARARMLASWA
jgi:hypothetical protein